MTKKKISIVFIALAILGGSMSCSNSKGKTMQRGKDESTISQETDTNTYIKLIMDSISNNDKKRIIERYEAQEKFINRDELAIIEGREKDDETLYTTIEDVSLCLKIKYLALLQRGFKPVPDSLFKKKVKEFYKIDLNDTQHTQCRYIREHDDFFTRLTPKGLGDDEVAILNTELDNSRWNFFFYKDKKIIVFRLPILPETMRINEDGEFEFSYNMNDNDLHYNNFIFYGNRGSLVRLLNSGYSIFLEQLLFVFGYDKEPLINKMVLEEYYKIYTEEAAVAEARIGGFFFTKDCNNRLEIRRGLLDYVNEHTTATDNRFIYALGEYMDHMYFGDPDRIYYPTEDPLKKFTALEKAEIVAHIASIENPAFWKYKDEPGNKWSNVATHLYNLSVSNPEVIDLIVKNNYFNIPNMKEVIENLEYEKGPDPE